MSEQNEPSVPTFVCVSLYICIFCVLSQIKIVVALKKEIYFIRKFFSINKVKIKHRRQHA